MKCVAACYRIALVAALAFAFGACDRAAPPSSAVASTAAKPALALKPPTEPVAKATPADKPNPEFKVTTFDGRPYDLATQRGHWVVVNFWATWCGPCLQEIPDLTAFIKTRKDVAVVGLAFQEVERSEMEAFLKEHQPGYPIAIVDPYHPLSDFDEPRALPTSYLIAPDGSVAHKFLGPITIKELQQQIDKSKPAS